MLKTILMIGLSLLLIGGIFIGCSDQIAPTGVDQTMAKGSDETLRTLSKVTSNEVQYTLDLFEWGFYGDCGVGANLYNVGEVEVFETEKITKNGNVIFKARVDYFYPGNEPVKLIQEGTFEEWILVSANNPWSFVGTSNGNFNEHYGWNETYRNADGQMLHTSAKGNFKIDKDGNIVFDLFRDYCR